MNLRKAAEMALEALSEYTNVVTSGTDPTKWDEVVDGGGPAREAIQALRQALAQPEQEPERIVPPVPDYAFDWCNFKKVDLMEGKQAPWQSVQCTCGGTIYFKHTKRELVGLTEDEFEKVLEQNNEAFPFAVYQQLEAKLKEKNG